MNLTEFYKLHEDDLVTDFTKEDLIQYLKILPAYYLFDIICEVCLGYVEDAICYAAECMIELRDQERALERIITQNPEL